MWQHCNEPSGLIISYQVRPVNRICLVLQLWNLHTEPNRTKFDKSQPTQPRHPVHPNWHPHCISSAHCWVTFTTSTVIHAWYVLGRPPFSLKLPLHVWDVDPIWYMVPWNHPSPLFCHNIRVYTEGAVIKRTLTQCQQAVSHRPSCPSTEAEIESSELLTSAQRLTPCETSASYRQSPAYTTAHSSTPHHTTTTVLRPFFRDHPGEPVPEENFWTLWCKGRLPEADTPTIRRGATPSGLTSAHLHHPPHIFAGRMPFLPHNQ